MARVNELYDLEYTSVNTLISNEISLIQKAHTNVCFIHSCTTPINGTEILDSILDTVTKSGILDILDFLIINNVGLPLNDTYTNLHPKIQVNQYSSDITVFELPTLKLLYKYSVENPNVNVLYLHTKGVSYTKHSYTYSKNTDWVTYMLYFLVQRYSKCLRLLKTHDTVGCDFSTLFNRPHYAGNFWWATTNYLKTLSTSVLNEKHDAEWWLLSNSPNKHVLHTSNFDWYSQGAYKLENYIQNDSTSPSHENIEHAQTVGDTVLQNHCACVSLIEVSKGGGLCNQLMAFLSGIFTAIQQQKRIVIVDDFNPQIVSLGSVTYAAARDTFDLGAMNELLSKYSITCIDKRDLTYSILSVHYGTPDVKHDLTSEILNRYVFDTVLYIPQSTNLNILKGDPAPNVPKMLFLKYSINGHVFEDSFDESAGLCRDVCLNLARAPFSFEFNWIYEYNQHAFNEFTKYLRFSSTYTSVADLFLSRIQKNTHVVHIRNEDDALDWWSKQNGMNIETFKNTLELKYISLIEQHIPKDDHIILLTYKTDSSIIKYLNSNTYSFSFTTKSLEGREANALVDLIIGSRANGVFIGNFNPNRLRGSSFSYTILQMMDSHRKKVLVDLDSIVDDAIVS